MENEQLASKKADIRSMNQPELRAYLQQLGWPAFRGQQLFLQAQKKMAASFSQMSDLPKPLRDMLSGEAELCDPTVVARHVSQNKDTVKLLLEFADGERVEMALMLYRRENSRNRATCCVSTQSGCAMGCSFCATSMFRQFRNLTAGEIVRQVQLADIEARQLGFEGVSNVVYMGMGEPLANMAAVRRSVELLTDAQGMCIGARRITISTCGLIKQIYQLAEWGTQINLAVSLHSAEQQKRAALMPVAVANPLPELMQACRDFRARTGRRVTVEYALIEGQNDSAEDARKLGNLLTGTDILVNIIPANAFLEKGIRPTAQAGVQAFCQVLEKAGAAFSVRESRGRDIEAACGQLRKRN